MRLSMYWDFLKLRLKVIIEYPSAFWTEAIAKIMGWGADLIIVYLMISRFNTVLNWSAYEVLLLFAINATTYALAGFFMYGSFAHLANNIRMGILDDMLTKPINPFAFLCFKSFAIGYLGNLIAAGIAIVICFINLHIALTPLNFLYLFLMIAGGTLIQCGLFMLSSIPVFWLVKADELMGLVTSLRDFIKYPISIYDRWIQVLLSFIVPVAFISFFPSQLLLNKTDFLGFSPVIAYLSPLVGLVLFFLGYVLFFLGLKSYKSSGT